MKANEKPVKSRSAIKKDSLIPLLVFGLALFVYAVYGFNGELRVDDSIFIYAGQQMAKGVPMYISVFDIITPLGYMLSGYGVWFSQILGWDDIFTARLIFYLLGSLSVVGVYLLGKSLFQSTRIGLFSSIVFLSFETFGRLSASGPRSKTPMVLFGVLCLLYATERKWFRAGLFGSLSFLTWQPAGIFPFVAVVISIAQSGKDRYSNISRTLGGIALPILVISVYFYLIGAFSEMIYATVIHGFRYHAINLRPFFEQFIHLNYMVRNGYSNSYIPFHIGLFSISYLYLWTWLKNKSLKKMFTEDRFAPILLSFPLFIIYSLIDFQGPPDFFVLLPYIAIGFGFFLELLVSHFEENRPWNISLKLRKLISPTIMIFLLLFSLFNAYTNRDNGLNDQKKVAENLREKFGDNFKLLSLGGPQLLVILKMTNPNRYIFIDRGIDRLINDTYPGGLKAWIEEIDTYDPVVVSFHKVKGEHENDIRYWMESKYRRFHKKRYVETPKIYTKNEPMSFVVILTDDQRWDTLWAMPILQEKMVGRGVTFANAFVSTPLCCPFRASLLSGGFYPHNTEVLTNWPPNGGVQKFKDDDTLATELQKAGYKTAIIGKYMNQYKELAPYIPPGWSSFVSRPGPPFKDESWTNFSIVSGSSTSSSSEGEIKGPFSKYLTDFYRDEALDFIEKNEDFPFFILISVDAPHSPATPSSSDQGLFAGYLYRNRAYDEEDLSNKSSYTQKEAKGFEKRKGGFGDEFIVRQLRSLQSVDRMIGDIFDKLEEKGWLNKTLVIFTSDNGFMWGEHRLFGKTKPYEESIRVPLVLVLPGIRPRVDNNLVVSNLDIGPTLLSLAGVERASDGLSLLPLLINNDSSWREEFLIQSFFKNWAGLRVKKGTKEWKYIEWANGEKELYDLTNDPYEEKSLHNEKKYNELIDEFSEHVLELKGVTIKDHLPPTGFVGEDYTFQFEPWGGKGPYTWSIFEGKLPEGLSLNSSSGLISGTPTNRENQVLLVKVQSSSNATYTKNPQSFVQEFKIKIMAPEKN